MTNYVTIDEWNIIEEGLHLDNNRIYESIMSIGNGKMGIRGNFEEDFTGDSLKGTYIAGVYYPDKTRVGWWKNGYPEYFAKVINAADFIGIKVELNGENLDLAKSKVCEFKRTLNMKNGYLLRSFVVEDTSNNKFKIEVKRFLSMARSEIGAISYSITPIDNDATISFTPYLNGDISNEDSNYDEKFWNVINKNVDSTLGHLTLKTKKLDFEVTTAMKYNLFIDGSEIEFSPALQIEEKFVANKLSTPVKAGSTITIFKYVAVTSSRYYEKENLTLKAYELVKEASKIGFEELLQEHSNKWAQIWNEGDIVIDGDPSAEQAIRFNIFQLNQTYTGEDSRLNIGPKGFTGEKYGGSTYWDTEAYCIPFYLSTREAAIAKNLLIYRYNQLDKAKENAAKLGLKGALYPMVTMNGEECHNEWEITFEEIHRNAAIPYAIFNYVNYTGDEAYLAEYGLDVLVETSRFWASRATYNKFKDKYMILGVTGPNEYENNVNNNWYTNTMATWNLKYTIKVIELLKDKYSAEYKNLENKLNLKAEEIEQWKDVINKMYFPYSEELGIFLQQDGYLDKEQILVKDLSPENLPLNQKWSWDRILRSCFIKQADVLQGLYLLDDKFSVEVKKRNFDFYEQRTVHESSLSPCIHSIIAAEVGYEDKAYDLYLRTARLDLDNYNNDTVDGLHITSMAGTWMSIVHGFGGLRIKDNTLSLNPFIPKAWTKYSFKVLFRNHLIKVSVSASNITLEQQNGETFSLLVKNKRYTIHENETITINK
ncbi:glycoside hydrolase family 65 protein [Clostridium hydrogenum]|uniref:glycoside hydrolase family 65 protein n=1 Tax=Clostridium hydrogenum TaxID=2855764 RepID=UPI001F3E2CF0|nr:glycoside hydrolase family 65 protein [Clostridium hydrogenum]